MVTHTRNIHPHFKILKYITKPKLRIEQHKSEFKPSTPQRPPHIHYPSRLRTAARRLRGQKHNGKQYRLCERWFRRSFVRSQKPNGITARSPPNYLFNALTTRRYRSLPPPSPTFESSARRFFTDFSIARRFVLFGVSNFPGWRESGVAD